MQTMTATEYEILLDRRATTGIRKIAQALGIRTTGRSKPQLITAIAQVLAAGNHPQAIVTYRLGTVPTVAAPAQPADDTDDTKTCGYLHHDFPADRASFTIYPFGTVCGDHYDDAITDAA